MVRRWMSLAILVMVAVVFCAVPSSGSAADKPVSLTYASFFPAQSRISILSVEWAKELEKRTKGKIKVKYYPAASLVTAQKTYEAVTKGAIDIGLGCFAYTPGRFPLMEVTDLPLGYKSGYVATRMVNEFYRKFKPAELSGVKVLYLHAHGPGILHTRKPLQRLEDIRGKTIRSTGLSADIAAALGGVPASMPMTEAYYALNNGLAEGIMTPMESLLDFKLGEVVKFSVEDFGAAYTTTFFLVMNRAKWNSLSKEVQQVIDALSEEFMERQGRLWDDLDREGREFTLSKGNKIVQLSREENERWAEAVKPLLGAYVKKAKSRGLPGDDAVKFCLDYLRTNQK